jgi:hypothetical protein
MLGDYYRHIRINFPINPEVISSSPSKAHRQTTCENATSKKSYQGNMLRQIVPHGTGIFEENRRPQSNTTDLCRQTNENHNKEYVRSKRITIKT